MTVVVDTSALISMLLNEAGAPDVELALTADSEPLMSTATYVELMLVAEGRKGPTGALLIDEMMREADITLIAHDERAAQLAVDGWRRFGKGRHPASLNLGDCYAYGLARSLGVPILCVGDDFAQTDIETRP